MCFVFITLLVVVAFFIIVKYKNWFLISVLSAAASLYCCCCWEFVNGRARKDLRCCVWRAVVVFSFTHTRARTYTHTPMHTHVLTHSHTLFIVLTHNYDVFFVIFSVFFFVFSCIFFFEMKNFCCAFDLFLHRRQLRQRQQRWLRHFLKNCNSILLLFVCSVCCSNWNLGGLQHAAGFHLKLTVVVAQCAQWSFVTVIPVHFLIVLDQFVCVF